MSRKRHSLLIAIVGHCLAVLGMILFFPRAGGAAPVRFAIPGISLSMVVFTPPRRRVFTSRKVWTWNSSRRARAWRIWR